MSATPAPNPGNTAVVTITVTQFNPGGICTINSPAVTTGLGSSGKPRVYQAPGYPKLYIKSQGKAPLYIQFAVQAPDGSTPYAVQSISFVGQLTDPTGTQTFPVQPIASGATSVMVQDTFWAQPMWNYSIVIKNTAGQTATIDPGISNTDED